MAEIEPQIDPSAYLAPGAVVRGVVTIGPQSSLWFGVVIRGDVEPITIGARTNVQDGTIIHTSRQNPTVIGDDVTIGHGAILHGCVVKDGALIGIRATVLDGAVIGKGALVAAGALVPPKMQVPPGSIVMGFPAKVVGQVDEAKREYHQYTVDAYIKRGEEYRSGKY
jgi:carbonic anhydrase/acetyltransferase-like protein (isoleucine patch superfamily)